MPTIVIVDDEKEILEPLEKMLLDESFSVRAFINPLRALEYLKLHPVDLVIFDIKMPELDGLSLLHRVRAYQPQIPAIFLSSKNDDADQLIGFSVGADDYVGKPFTKQLLIFRIKSVLRRYAPREQNSPKLISIGDLTIDRDRHLVTWKGVPVSVTVTECMILLSLGERPGVVKTRTQLMEACYQGNVFVSDRTIDSHVRNVRAKLKQVDEEANFIITVHGLGYKIVI
jgi:two-component system response regulator ChvI